MHFPLNTKVRITSNSSHLPFLQSRVGQEGVVIHDDKSDDRPYKVQFEDGDYAWFNAEDLEVLSADTAKILTLLERLCRHLGIPTEV